MPPVTVALRVHARRRRLSRANATAQWGADIQSEYSGRVTRAQSVGGEVTAAMIEAKEETIYFTQYLERPGLLMDLRHSPLGSQHARH